MISALMVLSLFAATADSPDAFLDSLCSHSSGIDGAEYWSDAAHPTVDSKLSNPDSLALMLEDKSDLAVEPGRRLLLDQSSSGEAYSVEYANSRWTWTDESGRDHVQKGRILIEWVSGEYYWRELPLKPGMKTISVSTRERLITGFLFTLLIVVFGLIAVSWVKRRYS